MKINCDYFKNRREARERAFVESASQWHDWYAWYPTRMYGGGCRWLETVKRRGRFYVYGIRWEYMPKESTLELSQDTTFWCTHIKAGFTGRDGITGSDGTK